MSVRAILRLVAAVRLDTRRDTNAYWGIPTVKYICNRKGELLSCRGISEESIERSGKSAASIPAWLFESDHFFIYVSSNVILLRLALH